MDLSISKIRSSISNHKLPLAVAAAALTVGIYLKKDLVKKAFKNLIELAEYMKLSLFDQKTENKDQINIEEKIRRAHQKIDEEGARRDKLAKEQLEREKAEIDAEYERKERIRVEGYERKERIRVEGYERKKRIREEEYERKERIRVEEYERKERIRKEEYRKRAEEFERESDEKIRKIRAEAIELKRKRKEEDEIFKKEVPIIVDLWIKYQDVINVNCTKEDPAIFQDMSVTERFLDNRLTPECCSHARILIFSNSYDGSYYTFKELDKVVRKLMLKVHPDKVKKDLDYGEIFRKLGIAADILKLCRFEKYFYKYRKYQRFSHIDFSSLFNAPH